MIVGNFTIPTFECRQKQAKTKIIVCLWKISTDTLSQLGIFYDRGHKRKLLYVTGFAKVFEATELDFGGAYTLMLYNAFAKLILRGTSYQVDSCKSMKTRCI